jgi:N-acetylglucosamine-6-phosphate deacetylase
MVYGTPVITHSDFKNQMPEFESIQTGVTGAFFKKDNIDSLADMIIYWKLQHFDREKVRLACFEMIDNYYNPKFQLQEIYKNIDLNEK